MVLHIRRARRDRTGPFGTSLNEGQGFDIMSALPVPRSTGTELRSCTISQEDVPSLVEGQGGLVSCYATLSEEALDLRSLPRATARAQRSRWPTTFRKCFSVSSQ